MQGVARRSAGRRPCGRSSALPTAAGPSAGRGGRRRRAAWSSARPWCARSAAGPFFLQQAGGRAVCLEVRAVDDDALGRPGRLRQSHEDAGEHAVAGPSNVPVVERLVRTVDRRSIAPAQAVALDVDDPAQDATVVHPRLATRPREIGRKARYRLIGQPKQIAHGGILPPEAELDPVEPGQPLTGPDPKQTEDH